MPSWSEDNSRDKEEPNYLASILIFEGLFALNSYMASESPEGYGALLTLLSPLGTSSNVSDTINYVGVGSAMSIGLYNVIELKDDSYSKSEIFKKIWWVGTYLLPLFGCLKSLPVTKKR